MIRTSGRLLIVLGCFLLIPWSLVSVSYVPSLWQVTSRFDILLALMAVTGIGLAVAALFSRLRVLDQGAACVAAGIGGAMSQWTLESQWSEPLLVFFAAIVIVVLAAGAVTSLLTDAQIERVTAGLRPSPSERQARRAGRTPAVAGAAAPARPSGGVPAGWYPDPAGLHASRYWDGSAWTVHVS